MMLILKGIYNIKLDGEMSADEADSLYGVFYRALHELTLTPKQEEIARAWSLRLMNRRQLCQKQD